MNTINKNCLRLSVLDVELPEGPINKKPGIECSILLNDKEYDNFSNPDYQTQIPLVDGTDTFRVTLTSKQSKELIGCISFLSQMFFPFKGQSFTQWITLFDSPEDDEFDGDVGVDDEETPRALFTFTIESSGYSYIQEDPKPAGAFSSPRKDVVNNYNYIGGSQLFGSNGHDISLGVNERSSQNLIETAKIDKEGAEKPNFASALINPFSQFNSQYVSEEHNIVAKDFVSEEPSDDAREPKGEKASLELEERIIDLINVLKSQRHEFSENWKQDFQSTSSKNETEKDYLLQLEIEKNKMLEVTLRQAETQLSKTEEVYQEFEQRSKAQLQQVIEESRRINKENYDLKKRINELESQLSSNKVNLGDNTKASSASPDKVTKTLREELENTKKALQGEKSFALKLQLELNKALQSNSLSPETFKGNKEQYEQELKALVSEKAALDKIANNYKTKYESMEMKHQSLETELQVCHSEIKRLVQQLEEYKSLGINFRKSIDDLNNQKNKEIQSLKEQLANFEYKNNELQRELSTSKKQLEYQSEYVKNPRIETKIKELEANLSQLEDEKRALQNYVQLLENRNQSPIKERTQQSKETDLLKFEIRELKLSLNEVEDVKQANHNFKMQIKVFQEENVQLRESMAATQKRLYATAAELVKQTSITVEQNNIITNLNQQMQILDESLKKAFHNIAKLQASIETQKKVETTQQPSRDSYSDKIDIDQRLNEFLSQHMIPMKFMKINDGVYIFGSKQLRLQVLNNRLTVRFRDGNMNLEEFIRLYAHQELLRMKMPKSDNYYLNIDQEKIPHEAKSNQVLWDINENQRYSPQRTPERVKTENSQSSSQALSRLLKSDKKESSLRKSKDISEQQKSYDDTSEYIIFDISPQGSRDASLSGKTKKTIKYPLADRKTDSSQAFKSSLRNYETDTQRHNSVSARSNDSFRANTSSRLNNKK